LQNFESKKREILDRVDILDVVSEHVTLKRSGRRWVGLCPFHAEKTPSFTVSPERGLFKCFGCGKGGDVFSFVQNRENVPFIEAMRTLADRAGVELGRAGETDSGAPTRADIARVNNWAAGFFRSNLLDETTGRTTREYLRGRRVSEDTSERFSLGLASEDAPSLQQAAARSGIQQALLLASDLVRQGDQGRVYETFRNRLMFPIRDATGRVIGFGGRTLVDDRAKYLNTGQNALFDKGRHLYGTDLARDAISRTGRAVVVEGYTDCLAAHQAGFAETVATLGTALTESQVDLLRRYCDEIILLFDSDDAGEAAAERAIRAALPRCVKVRLGRIPSGKDPSEYLTDAGPEDFSDVLNGAIDALEFKWSQTSARFKGKESDAGRREATDEFLGLIEEVYSGSAIDNIQRGLLVDQVALLLGLARSERERLHHDLAELGRRRRNRGPSPTRTSELGRREPPVDEEQAAWTRVLEVLLNEPSAADAEALLLDVERVADDRDRRIAAAVFGLLERDRQFVLADVLARLHEPLDAQRVEKLTRDGEARGNYINTLRLAVERIRRASDEKELELGRQRCVGAKTAEGPFEDSRDELESYNDGVQRHRHFVPRKWQRAKGVVSNPSDNVDRVASTEQP